MTVSRVGVNSPVPACACDKRSRTACDRVAPTREFNGLSYCVLHYPDADKVTDFEAALQRRLKRAGADLLNLSGVWFPKGASFGNRHFRHKRVLFTDAVFNGVADFSDAKFDGRVYFTNAAFKAGANFQMTTFKGRAYFSGAQFSLTDKAGGGAPLGRANFVGAVFDGQAKFISAVFEAEADFTGTIFREETLFSYAAFRGRTDFTFASISAPLTFSSEGRGGRGFGPDASLSFKHATIKESDLVSFHVISLCPHWFVDVDARKIYFAHVDWRPLSLSRELEELRCRTSDQPHRKLAVAYRHLAVNAEENYQYDLASDFRHRALEAQRRAERWGTAPWKLSWWYWLASGYGEKVAQAFLVLLVIWLLFAFVYFGAQCTNPSLLKEQICVEWDQKSGAQSPRGDFSRALAYTLAVMTLQRPEPRPNSAAAQIAVSLCVIFGPLQGALLALAIRRKFMR